MEQLDYPSHFKLGVVKGALWLFPARLVSLELQAKTTGIPLEVLRLAQRLVAEGKGLESHPTEGAKAEKPSG
jgi:hypothetical protein